VSRFSDVIARQLDLFETEQRAVIEDCETALQKYNAADRDEAEARYEEYLDLVETATDELAALRDNFAAAMDEEAAEEYEAAFNRAVAKRLPRFALEIEDS
jgi:nitrate reductase assembly molybdenum cofactor insertion protein NarJ